MLRLVYMDGNDEKSVDLRPGVHTVGRATENDIVLNDKSVSSQHLRIEVAEDGTANFRDLMSSNGTRLRGKRTDAGRLIVGDRLRIGRIKVRVAAADSDAPPEFADEPSTLIDNLDLAFESSRSPGPLGADAVLVAAADADGIEGEGTPVAPLPAVRAGQPAAVFSPTEETSGIAEAPRALMVMPPAGAPVVSGPDGRAGTDIDAAAAKRKKIRMAAIGAGVVLLAALLLAPSSSSKKAPANGGARREKWVYADEVERGIELFNRRDFAKAAEVWDAADQEAKRLRMKSAPRSARVFAEIARALVALGKSGEFDTARWNAYIADLEKIHSSETVFERFSADLSLALRREYENAKTLAQARRLLDDDDFAAAAAALDRVAADSPLAAHAKQLKVDIGHRRLARLEMKRQREREAGDYSKLLATLEELRRLKPADPTLAEAIEEARTNSALAKREREYVDVGQFDEPADAAGHRAALDKLENATTRLWEGFPEEYTQKRNLQRIQDDYLRRIFVHQTALYFHAWDEDKLAAALKDPRANVVALAGVRRAMSEGVAARDGYEAATKARDPEAAQEAISTLLAMDELPAEHPLRQWALKRQVKPEAVGRAMLENAEVLLGENQFAEARWQLARAQAVLEYSDPTALMARLAEYRTKRVALQSRRRAAESLRNTDRMADIDDELSELDDHYAEDRAAGEERKQFLDLRADLLKRSSQYLNAGIREKNARDFLLARDCVAYPLNDQGVRDQSSRVAREYQRAFGGMIPALPARGAEE